MLRISNARRFALVCLASLLVAESTHAAIIRFKPTAQVDAAVIKLGDIADVTDPNPGYVARLRDILIAPAPEAGRTQRLTFDQIRSRLQAHGVSLATTAFGGANIVTVSGPTAATTSQPEKRPAYRVSRPVNGYDQRRAEKLVSDAIARHIQSIAPQLGPVTVDAAVDSQDVALVQAGKITGFDVRKTRPILTADFQTTSIAVFDRDEKQHVVNIRYRLHSQPLVWAARHAMTRGEILQASDLVQIPAVQGKPGLGRIDEIVGKQTRRNLRPNETVSAGAVKAVPLVRTGEVVTVRTRIGGIVVQRQMKAVTSGALGDSVTLSSLPRGQERVFGRVVALREVEVGTSITGDATTTARQSQTNQTGVAIQRVSNPSARGTR
ncbi:MAG: flagellar basal body P-ring formation chaperone FlgA [Planctomycetota bacterium]|nr:flagellar basal body P-ring formation chaperone FlgA [Planctomycetota bacterium]